MGRKAVNYRARARSEVTNLSLKGLSGYYAGPAPQNAAIAQLVEQRIRNAWVRGSNPLCGTRPSL